MMNRLQLIGFITALMVFASYPVRAAPCNNATLNGQYAFWAKGAVRDLSSIKLDTGTWTALGTFSTDGQGNLKGVAIRREPDGRYTYEHLTLKGSYTITPDCMGTARIEISPRESYDFAFVVVSKDEFHGMILANNLISDFHFHRILVD